LQKLAAKLKQSDARGYRVTRVYPGTKAVESGLQVGDIITALNGERIVPKGMQDAGQLGLRVRKLTIGDSAKLTVLRNGQSSEMTVTLDRTRVTPEEANHEQNHDFEMTVREITFFDRDENRWGEDVNGVIVQQVEPAGWAGLGGIGPGDLIQRIADYEIRDLKTFRKAMEAVTQAQPERVVFVVLRGVKTRFEYVEPEWKPAAEDGKKPATKEE
jgi:S1-C subfamily serine protease